MDRAVKKESLNVFLLRVVFPVLLKSEMYVFSQDVLAKREACIAVCSAGLMQSWETVLWFPLSGTCYLILVARITLLWLKHGYTASYLKLSCSQYLHWIHVFCFSVVDCCVIKLARYKIFFLGMLCLKYFVVCI